MSTATDYRTRELAKRDRQAQRRTGRNNKQATVSAFTTGVTLGISKGKK